MKLRTEDALGFFSTQMLGQIALPSVARSAVAERCNRAPVGTDSASSLGLPQTRNGGPAPKDGVGYVAHVDRQSGQVQVVAGPGEELPGEPLTAALYRAAATTGEHRFTLGDVHTYRSLDEMNRALQGELVPPGLAARARRLIDTMRASKMPAPPADSVFVRCDCSRVVPLTEWDGLYDCCSECAHELSLRDHKEIGYELDWTRLAPEFTD